MNPIPTHVSALAQASLDACFRIANVCLEGQERATALLFREAQSLMNRSKGLNAAADPQALQAEIAQRGQQEFQRALDAGRKLLEIGIETQAEMIQLMDRFAAEARNAASSDFEEFSNRYSAAAQDLGRTARPAPEAKPARKAKEAA